MKRFVLVLSLMAVMAMLLLAMAVPAFADPNENACHGQVIGGAARNGVTPPAIADSFFGQLLGLENAGDVNKLVKEARFLCG